MGYETRIYVVELFSVPTAVKLGDTVHEVSTGKVLAQLDLCKAGYDGPIPTLLAKIVPHEPLFALPVNGPTQLQEAVSFLRDWTGTLPALRQTIIEREAYRLWDKAGRPHGRSLEFWYEAEHNQDLFLPKTDDIEDLASALESGYILTDKYGDYLGVSTVDEFMEALEQEMLFGEPYRRFRWAHNLIKSIKESPEQSQANLRVISYGH